MKKPPRRLFKNKDVVHSYQHDRSTRSRMKHLVRDHVDILQNIEFALVSIAREDPTIDDRIIDQALHYGIKGTEPTEDDDPRVAVLFGVLADFRDYREDVSDDIWIAALRKVDESVQLHSELKPGEKSYLEFVQEYVA
jgi:hypothetical protein